MRNVRVTVVSYMGEMVDTPVELEVVGPGLEPIDRRWIRIGSSQTFLLENGPHAFRARLGNGGKVQQVVEISDRTSGDVVLDLHQLSPHESQEWAYLGITMGRLRGRPLESVDGETWTRLWRKDGAHWLQTGVLSPWRWTPEGVWGEVSLPDCLCALQVGGPRARYKFVLLPSAGPVRILIRPSVGPADVVHPYNVAVAGPNRQAESILSLLQRGAATSGQELLESIPEAQELLLHKFADPAAAAVGGYLLLRTGEVARLRSWASNLANQFEWLPDGAILRAWLALGDARGGAHDGKYELEHARALLLEGVRRGVPIYTIGLRLLYDGLRICDDHAHGHDRDVAAALGVTSAYTAAADWSTATTTFVGERPDEPSLVPIRGVSRDGYQRLADAEGFR